MAQGWQPRQAAAEKAHLRAADSLRRYSASKPVTARSTTMLGNLANLRDTLELGGFSFENTRR